MKGLICFENEITMRTISFKKVSIVIQFRVESNCVCVVVRCQIQSIFQVIFSYKLTTRFFKHGIEKLNVIFWNNKFHSNKEKVIKWSVSEITNEKRQLNMGIRIKSKNHNIKPFKTLFSRFTSFLFWLKKLKERRFKRNTF